VETSDAKLQEKLHSIEALHVGHTMRWIVERVEPLQIFVRPESKELQAENITATIHLSSVINLTDGGDDLESALEKFSNLKKKEKAMHITPLHPFYGVRPEQVLTAKIIHLRKKKEEGAVSKEGIILSLATQLPQNGKLSGEGLNSLVMTDSLSLLIDATGSSNKGTRMPQWMGKDCIKEGQLYAGVVTQRDSARVTVALSPFVSSHLSLVDISSHLDLLQNFKANCFVGLRLVVAVTAFKSTPHRVLALSRVAIESAASGQFYADLSNSISIESVPNSFRSFTLKPGAVVTGMINLLGSSRISRPPAIQVQLPCHQLGRICATEIADSGNWTVDLTPLFTTDTQKEALQTESYGGLKHGDIVPLRVVSVSDQGHAELSSRPSRLVLLFYFHFN
jgi:hypothetical protein